MRAKVALLCVLAAAVVAQAAPPVVTVPAEVAGDVGSFVAVRASVTDAKVVKFVPVDPGLNVYNYRVPQALPTPAELSPQPSWQEERSWLQISLRGVAGVSKTSPAMCTADSP